MIVTDKRMKKAVLSPFSPTTENIFEKKLLIYLFLPEKYYFCSVFNNNENKMKALYNTYFFFFYYFYFSNKVKREFVCVR